MDEYIERYLDRVKGLKAKATYDSRKTDLKNFNNWIEERGFEDVTELDALDIEDYFIEQRSHDYSPNTMETRYEAVRGFYSFLDGKLDVIDDTPFDDLNRREYIRGMKSKKIDRGEMVYITPEEVEAVANNVPNPKVRNELIVRLFWQTGIRCGELVRLEVDDIDRESRSINVWANKTNESRTVFYQPSLDVLLNQWLDGPYRSSFTSADRLSELFITRRGKLKESQVNRMIHNAAENANVQEVLYEDAAGRDRFRITPHIFRHGHAVHALKQGIDVRTVQKHLGHANIETTMKYLQLIDEDVKEGYRRFEVDSPA